MNELRDKIYFLKPSELCERKHHLVKFNPLHFHFVCSRMQVGVCLGRSIKMKEFKPYYLEATRNKIDGAMCNFFFQ